MKLILRFGSDNLVKLWFQKISLDFFMDHYGIFFKCDNTKRDKVFFLLLNTLLWTLIDDVPFPSHPLSFFVMEKFSPCTLLLIVFQNRNTAPHDFKFYLVRLKVLWGFDNFAKLFSYVIKFFFHLHRNLMIMVYDHHLFVCQSLLHLLGSLVLHSFDTFICFLICSLPFQLESFLFMSFQNCLSCEVLSSLNEVEQTLHFRTFL